MYPFSPAYPTLQHEQAAKSIVDFFSRQPNVDAVLLTCSCARGKATHDSCLDICILVPAEMPADTRRELKQAWEGFYQSEAVFVSLRQIGQYSNVDLDFSDGVFVPPRHDWTTGPDEFEVEIGNALVYSVPLWEQSGHLERLKAQWLPYYDETLRHGRLEMVRRFCLNNLDHIPLYVKRGLYFQSFHRLWNAFGEFLQALFISRRTWPIAYDKWIREQVEDILGLPELYRQLPGLFEIQHFESHEIADKAETLRLLLEQYVDE